MSRRVLVLADNPYFGGPSSHILTLLEAFRSDARFDLSLAVLPGKTPDLTLFDRASALGFAPTLLPMSGRFDPRVLPRLRRFVRGGKFELVHTHGYRGALLARLAIPDVPVVSTSHGVAVAPALRTRVWQWAALRAMRRHRAIIACSDHVRGWLIGQRLPANRITTVYNGYRPPAGVTPPERAELGIAPEDLAVLYAGRLVPGKGVELLIEAMARRDAMTLLVAGDGPLRPALEALARRLGVSARFLGRVDAAAPWYAFADVVALPSMMEALPMTLIEAAAMGKPVLASRAGGIPEVCVDGETGILVPPGDIAALREALDQLAGPERRAEMGRNAREHWECYFTPETMAQRVAAVYFRALA